MSLIPVSGGTSSNARGFYPLTIDQSLRFNDNDSAYLSRTPATAGNRKTWTWSGWVKRGNSGYVHPFFFGVVTDDTNRDLFGFVSNDTFLFYGVTSGTVHSNLTTSQLFRDFSAWYHVVISVDTTQATASNRIKLYINGEQITSFSTSTYPSQNKDFLVNNTQEHTIGASLESSAKYFDGYLADVHFIDGQALTASDFGETKNGVWVAKAPSVTYGTNGFYLDFANSADIGNDVSGEGNDWTPNNFTASDVVLDSPTDNFCTWNPLATYAGGTYSDGNLNVATANTPYGPAIGTLGVSSGKYYCEITQGSGSYTQFGCVSADALLSTTTGVESSAAKGFAYVQNDGSFRAEGVTTSPYGASWTSADVIGMALNLDDDEVTFYKNGVSQGTQSITGGRTYLVAVSDNDGATGTTVTANFGQQSFTYTPPSGFNALSTANLPDPVIDPAQDASPEDYFDIDTYSGTSASHERSNFTFQPDFVWIKSRGGVQWHNLYDAVRGATKALASNSTDGEDTRSDGLLSFDADGFSLGSTDANVNTTGNTYVGWAWKANGSGVSNTDGSITSTVSANTTSGFSIVSYTGNVTSGATIGHGLSSAPDMVVVKSRDQARNWVVYHSANTTEPATERLILDGTQATADSNVYWNDTEPTTSVFSVGNDNIVNASGESYIAYCFHSVEGFSKFGQYEGGSSPFVYTGFRPALIWIKSIDSTSDWYCFDDKRLGYNVDNDFLELNDSEDEDTADLIDILSNGFKIRGSSGTDPNVSETYIYACWASNPFKYSNAR